MKVVPKLFVATSIQFPWEDRPQVAGHGVLRQHADHKNGIDGDAVAIEIRDIRNLQCDGHGAHTDGCTKRHDHALERVVARLVKEGEGNDEQYGARIVWRRGHPTVCEPETLFPGKPFVADDGRGMSVQIEAREIIEDNSVEPKMTARTINLAQVRKLESDYVAAEQHLKLRTRMFTGLSTFEETHFAAAKEHVEVAIKRFADLPWKKDVDAAIAEATRNVEQVLDELNQLAQKASDPAQAALAFNVFHKALANGEPRVKAALQPIFDIEKRAKGLLEIQDQAHAIGTKLDQIEEAFRKMVAEELPTIDAKRVPFEKTRTKIADFLERTKKPHDGADYAAMNGELIFLKGDVDAIGIEVEVAARLERVVKTEFDGRVKAVDSWQAGGGRKWAEDFLDSAAGFPGFNRAYWGGQLEKADAAVARELQKIGVLGELRYHVAKDQDRLKAAEQSIAPLTDLLQRIEADITRRSRDVIGAAFVEFGKRRLYMPTVWVEVKESLPGNSANVEVHIRNNDPQTMRVSIMVGVKSADHVTLRGNGQTARLALEIDDAITVKISGIRTAKAGAEYDGVVVPVDIRSGEIDPHYDGEIRHVPMTEYEPMDEQPTAKDVQMELDAKLSKNGRKLTYEMLPVPAVQDVGGAA